MPSLLILQAASAALEVRRSLRLDERQINPGPGRME